MILVGFVELEDMGGIVIGKEKRGLKRGGGGDGGTQFIKYQVYILVCMYIAAILPYIYIEREIHSGYDTKEKKNKREKKEELYSYLVYICICIPVYITSLN